MSDEPYERDPGLAAERTELAWGRSALSLIACGAVVARGIPMVTGAGSRLWVGIALLALGVAVWAAGVPLAAERAQAGRTGVRHPARRRELAPLAYGTAVVGIAALAIGAFFPA